METSPLIFRANQWTGLYTIGTSVMKKLGTHCYYSRMYRYLLLNSNSLEESMQLIQERIHVL